MNNNLPLVSIVVVSYNQSKYIIENLNSIKAQTYTNIELIVADDASTDDSVKVFDKWAQSNSYPVKKNYHTQNTGLATVLNECMDMATGKYIKFIAADDFLHPEAIEKCVHELEFKGERYGMVYSDTHFINEDSAILHDYYNIDYDTISEENFHLSLVQGNSITALTVMMRLDVLKETGKYDAQYLIEDYYRWLLISEKYLIAFIPQKLAYYRVHETNTSNAKKDLIDLEVRMLQMKFDKTGIMQEKLNFKIYQYYFSKKKLPKRFLEVYNNYEFKDRHLYIALKYALPLWALKLLKKIL